MSHQQKTLWTKDFTSIAIATILTAVGGEAMNLPISLLVFDETGSTFLSALVLICGVLPDIVLSVLVAPLIDKGGKKKWIVGLDIVTAVLYAVMGLYISGHAFNYLLYLIFVLAVGTISVFYRLAYDAWYPNLIPMGWNRRVMRSAIQFIHLSSLQCPQRQPFCMKKYPWHTFFIWLPVSRWYLSSWRAGFMRKRKKHRTIIPGSSIVRISGKDFII